MAHKFYYNGKLIRTSENHHYTHAVFDGNGKLVGCRGSLALAQQLYAECTRKWPDCSFQIVELEER